MLGARWDDVCISSTLAEATYRVDPKRQSMRIPHKHDHISVILYLSKHNYISFRIVNHLLGSGFQYVFFSRNLGEDEPILTSIFFRWVVQPPTTNQVAALLSSLDAAANDTSGEGAAALRQLWRVVPQRALVAKWAEHLRRLDARNEML